MSGTNGTSRSPLSLGWIFGVSTGALVLLLVTLSLLARTFSQEAVLSSASDRIKQRGQVLAGRLNRFLLQGDEIIREIELDLSQGVVGFDDEGVERALYSRASSHPATTEVSFTAGRGEKFAERGRRIIEREGRSQIAVVRLGDGRLWTTRTRLRSAVGAEFLREVKRRTVGSAFAPDMPFVEERTYVMVSDPTMHPTFSTPARQGLAAVRSDLHWSQLDEGSKEKRVVVSTQKAVHDAEGAFRGVLRVSISATELAESLADLSAGLSERMSAAAICDVEGRLIAVDGEPFAVRQSEEDLRAPPTGRAEPLAKLLETLRIDALLQESGEHVQRVAFQGRPHLLALESIPLSQGWVVALLISEQTLLADLDRRLNTSLGLGLVVVGVILVGGVLTLATVRGALRAIDRRTGQIEAFDFAPAAPASPIRDVAAVLERLELAKTAMRAMGQYVPMELVKRVYRQRKEPALGGELRDVTISFSDIAGFTTISEQMDPNQLASALGLYLESATQRVHEQGGIVDKYIGDAVMALFNAPEDVHDHPTKACLAALECRRANAELFATEAWRGWPPFPTRFGIHRAEVIVGHFGAPSRMSFTAVGDGVNLAARLEGLNKSYGTQILVSDVVRVAAGSRFLFRRVDLVAVKGKSAPTPVHELVEERDRLDPAVIQRLQESIARYEAALDAYVGGRFADAEREFSALTDDPAAVVMAERSRRLLARPPATPWDGVYRPTEK